MAVRPKDIHLPEDAFQSLLDTGCHYCQCFPPVDLLQVGFLYIESIFSCEHFFILIHVRYVHTWWMCYYWWGEKSVSIWFVHVFFLEQHYIFLDQHYNRQCSCCLSRQDVVSFPALIPLRPLVPITVLPLVFLVAILSLFSVDFVVLAASCFLRQPWKQQSGSFQISDGVCSSPTLVDWD